ncbi:hypothetical protein [Actinobaculum sp. 352]|uniref:hypothetical protein n=1 Tax=Actinobaculum sp. 352 TaxID=2490946 RepID=UPI000F7DDA02|nr:hypothetical protein [Actinobaculum sp. 352]RTE49552.1 hypothetical protein EKN07_05740 [Actinobaculum sp. 352]
MESLGPIILGGLGVLLVLAIAALPIIALVLLIRWFLRQERKDRWLEEQMAAVQPITEPDRDRMPSA